jgi:hypothetical protein
MQRLRIGMRGMPYGTFWSAPSPVDERMIEGRFPPARLLHPGGNERRPSRRMLPNGPLVPRGPKKLKRLRAERGSNARGMG